MARCSRTLVAAGVAALALTAAPRFAQAQDGAGAEVLFQKGHQLFEEKKYAEACPKFAESFRLDPVTGSLLALASCHEAEDKLATAWAEYVDVATRARREGKNDRADAAQQRATQLEPKLARLTVSLAPGAEAIAGLQVKRDGVVIGQGAFGTALPVDRGEHVVEASAPGRQAFTQRVTMADGANQVTSVPVLPEGATAVPPPDGVAGSPAPATGSPFPLRTLGIVTAAVGLVGIGVGSYFGATAIGKNSDSKANNHCDATNHCDVTGAQTRLDAISAGTTSTILFVVGGVLMAGGVVMFIVGGKSSSGGDSKTAIAAAPAVGPGGGGVALTGRF